MNESSPTNQRGGAAALAALWLVFSIASLWSFAAADTPPRLGRLSPALAVAGLVGLLFARRRAGGRLVDALVWFAAVVVATEAAFLILSRV